MYVLLPRIKRLEAALLSISALSANPTHPRKLHALIEIHKTAEDALRL